jgi:preprotein translocase subunit YajC
MTQSGIFGRIASIEENVVTLDVGNQVKIRMSKSAIAGTVTAAGKQS